MEPHVNDKLNKLPPEYEFNETPHLTTTPSNTQIDTRAYVCMTSTGKMSLQGRNKG